MLVQTIVILGSIVVKNPGCHAGDRGSIKRLAIRNNIFSYRQLTF